MGYGPFEVVVGVGAGNARNSSTFQPWVDPTRITVTVHYRKRTWQVTKIFHMSSLAVNALFVGQKFVNRIRVFVHNVRFRNRDVTVSARLRE